MSPVSMTEIVLKKVVGFFLISFHIYTEHKSSLEKKVHASACQLLSKVGRYTTAQFCLLFKRYKL
jgi:hypothetical protein